MDPEKSHQEEHVKQVVNSGLGLKWGSKVNGAWTVALAQAEPLKSNGQEHPCLLVVPARRSPPQRPFLHALSCESCFILLYNTCVYYLPPLLNLSVEVPFVVPGRVPSA